MTVSTQRADPPFAGHPGPVLAVAVTPDGTQIITAGDDGIARIWDRASGQQVGPALTGHTRPVFAVAVTPDGTQITIPETCRTARASTSGVPSGVDASRRNCSDPAPR